MQQQTLLRVGISLGSLLLVAIYNWWPELLKLDTTSLALLLVALIPWLQPIFKTIKLPGGFEVTMQELKQEVRAAAGAAQSAERKADLAVSTIVPAADSNELRHERVHGTPPLERLSQSYEQIRSEQKSGTTRTQAMTAIVREMIQVAQNLPETDIAPLLRSQRAGDRLAGYAYLYAKPNPALLSQVVYSVTSLEDKPFGEYWGLQAIGRNLTSSPTQTFPESVIRDLVAYSSRVQQGTDRSYELSKILNQMRGNGQSAA